MIRDQVLALLQDAGPDGLLQSEIRNTIAAPVSAHLESLRMEPDLKVESRVSDLIGGVRWILHPPGPAEPIEGQITLEEALAA